MKSTIRTVGVILVATLFLLGVTIHEAKADFIIDLNPGGVQLHNSDAYSDVTTLDSHVGTNGPLVTINTVENVNSGAGFATIKPIKDGILTSVTFIPADPTLFGDFSFRGQLLSAGDVTLTVTDQNGDPPQSFTFGIAHANQDFSRIGIISTDETIKEVNISSAGFKEVKQIDFSYAPGVTVPEPGILILLGIAMTGVAVASRDVRKI